MYGTEKQEISVRIVVYKGHKMVDNRYLSPRDKEEAISTLKDMLDSAEKQK